MFFSCTAQKKEETFNKKQYNIALEIVMLHKKIGISPLETLIHIEGKFDKEHERLDELYPKVSKWSYEKDLDLKKEKLDLKKKISTISKLPILKMRTLSPNRALVIVGKVKGPGDASGITFYLIKHDSKWIVIYRVTWVS
jgi:hypothetical protein